ncbi:MAG: DUF1080 domain-containing protein [Flavobacteriaceae bacterium]|nr:DUF1080 domain-containing protein [Flavobacteriaceae bacterium]
MKLQLQKRMYWLITALLSVVLVYAQSQEEIIGKWDLEVIKGDRILPSWLEVKLSGNRTLVGYFVAESGSARPISEVFFHEGTVDFSIPPQWDGFNAMHFSALVSKGVLEGTILNSEGEPMSFTGVRAPKLIRSQEVKWSKPRSLFDGTTLNQWKPLESERQNQWEAQDGLLVNPRSGVNLITEEKFTDFKLHIEARYPAQSNSGIYLRGRYEVQVEDSYGKEPSSILFGGVYGFLTPNEIAAKKAGEWQVFEITLIGRRVTIVANGKTVINDQIIPGITGGAIDSKEGTPGPIMLQGDHGVVAFRNISIQTPK